jgi:hypothetical protein
MYKTITGAGISMFVIIIISTHPRVVFFSPVAVTSNSSHMSSVSISVDMHVSMIMLVTTYGSMFEAGRRSSK